MYVSIPNCAKLLKENLATSFLLPEVEKSNARILNVNNLIACHEKLMLREKFEEPT